MTNIVTVPFHGDVVTAVITPDSAIYVPIRPICQRLGLSERGQTERLQRRPKTWTARVMHAVGGSGQLREMVCLPLSRLAWWLATVEVERVKPDLRERLELYQIECADVIDRHFRGLLHDEVVAANRRLERLREDLIARKPLWVKIRSWQAMGWGFDEIWRASKRSRAVVTEAIGDLLRCDLIPAAPAGTPFARPLAQPDLFAGA